MKTRIFYFSILVLFFSVFLHNNTHSQVPISVGNTVTETFSIGTSPTATLPTGWRVDKNNSVRTVGVYSSAVTVTDYRAGNNMSPTAANGIYNFGAGDPATATDRSIGGISSSSASKSVNVYVHLQNTGATPIDNFTVSYDVKKFRNGSNSAGFSIQMYYSTDGTTWTNAGTNFLTSFSPDADNNGFTNAPGATVEVDDQILSVSLAPSASLYLAWNYSVTTGTTTSNAQALGIDNVSITANASTPIPTLSVTPSSLSGFAYNFGNGPSGCQPFLLQGSNLTHNVVVTGSNAFEVGFTMGGSFFPSVQVTPVGGSVNQNIFVRMKSGLAVGQYTENITVSSTGATSQYVSASGEVYPLVPTITLNTSVLNGFTYVMGSGPSAQQTFTVTGINLSDDITLTPPTNYEISLTGGLGFAAQNPLILTHSGGSIPETTIYVRLKAGLSTGSYNGEILSASSTGATTQNITFNGNVTAPSPSAQVLLRPQYIDISSSTSESAVLMKLDNYPQDDVRFRLFNGSNQYNPWNEATGSYVSSTSYSSGPQVPGTPSTSTTFWILFVRGNNNSNAASYRDRLGPGYSVNYQTVALPAATTISSAFTLSGTFVGSGSYDNSEKYVVLAYSGTNLISAASTTLNTGTFSVVCPVGTTIDKIEVRAVDNTLIAQITGSWNATTNVGNFPCPTNITVFNVNIFDNQLPYEWENTIYWNPGTYYKTYQTTQGCDSILQLNLTTSLSNTIWVNRNIGTAVQANWSIIPGAVQYQLRYALKNTNNWILHSTTQNRFRIVNLTPATEYDLQIRFFNGTSWSSWTYFAPIVFETKEVNFQFTRDIGTKAIVEWTDLEHVSSYILQYKPSNSSSWINSGEHTTNSALINYPLNDNTSYDFRVIPRYQGVSMWWTAPQTLTTLNFQYWFTRDIGTRAILNFTSIPNATNYVVLWKETSSSSWNAASVNGTSTILNGLSSATSYDFRVNVYFGATVWGTTATKSLVTNLINIYPGPFVGSQVTFTWDAVTNPDASAYYLQIRETGNTVWQNFYTTTNSATATGLNNSLQYEYRLVVRYGNPEVSWGATEIYNLIPAKQLTSVVENGLKLYPNPVEDVLNFEVNVSENTELMWQVFDINGQLVMKGQNFLYQGQNLLNVDMQQLPSGIYFLNSVVNGDVYSNKIIKK